MANFLPAAVVDWLYFARLHLTGTRRVPRNHRRRSRPARKGRLLRVVLLAALAVVTEIAALDGAGRKMVVASLPSALLPRAKVKRGGLTVKNGFFSLFVSHQRL